MDPLTLLNYSTEVAKYHLRTNDHYRVFHNLGGATLDDVIMESVEKVLKSNVVPKTKSYVSLVTLGVISDLSAKHREEQPSSDHTTLNMKLSAQETREILDSEDILGNLKLFLSDDQRGLFETYIESTPNNTPSRNTQRKLAALTQEINEFLGIP